ncbi:MAG: oxidoreductase [Bacteroidetes bacterium]|nr:oxidoreductase [Bacteroidota bacterium]MBS1539419.1 oxidoreductase [Bacteroidota bacterium]
MEKTALLAGSTGLVGAQLLELLLGDERYTKVIAISRTPLSLSNSKLENVVCELHQLASYAEKFSADDVFCCLGTTIKKAKTKEAFRAVDYEAPLQLAQIAHQQGAQKFILVSALGANKNSSVFYNRVKGEVEEAVSAVGFKSCHIVRPSLLLGSRVEQRSGEDAAKIFFKLFGWAVPNKYRAIESIRVARAMVAMAQQEMQGIKIHESKELQAY